MKKVLLTLIVLMMVTVPAAMAAEASGDVYAGFSEKYLWRGFDLSDSVAVVQGGMDVSIGKFTFSYWSNMQAIDDASINGGSLNETDIIIDYSTDLGELASLSVGNILYDVDGFETTNELYLTVGLNTLLAPALTTYYDWDECEEDGLFMTLSIGHDLEISEKVALNFGALVSFNQNSDFAVGTYSGLHNYELSAGADIALTDTISASISTLFTEGISDNAKQLIDSETTAGVSLAYAF